MTKASSMSKDGRNLSKSRFGCYFHCSLVNFKIVLFFFKHMGYLWFVKKLGKCYFDLEPRTYKTRFVICGPKSLTLIQSGIPVRKLNI